MPRTPRRNVTALALMTLLALAGCASIPMSGPIGEGDVEVAEPGAAIPLAEYPEPDAGPERIVEGFLQAAGAGPYDDYAAARAFLTGTASAAWDPRARVLVFGDVPPEIEIREDSGSARVTLEVIGVLDEAGRYSEAAPGSREELVLSLVREPRGQWRISQLEDGVAMLRTNFSSLHRQVSVYFASPDGRHLVPETRWFPTRTVVTLASAQVLAGPSTWLQDAVVSGAPGGTRLSTASVTVEDGVATVDLAAGTRTEEADRGLLQAQLEATLSRVPGTLVTEVEVTVGGLPWEAGVVTHPTRDVAAGRGPYVLSGDRLAILEGGEVRPLEDAGSLSGLDARSPAIGLDDAVRVVLDGERRLMHLPTDASEPVEVWRGRRLVAPSVDRYGWVWTGERTSDGTLVAVAPLAAPGDEGSETAGDQDAGAADPDVVSATVQAGWLDGRTVRSVRVSRDGTRAAVVSVGDLGASIDVAGVVRDADGTPQMLSEPRRVGASLVDVSEVSWSDESTLAALGVGGSTTEPTVHTVPLGAPSSSMSPIDGTVGIAAGRGDRSLYVSVEDGTLYARQNVSWTRVVGDVRDPAFPG